jgi:hypothetical protein
MAFTQACSDTLRFAPSALVTVYWELLRREFGLPECLALSVLFTRDWGCERSSQVFGKQRLGRLGGRKR